MRAMMKLTPPSRKQRLRWAAEDLARVAVDTEPTVERTRKELAGRFAALAARPLSRSPRAKPRR